MFVRLGSLLAILAVVAPATAELDLTPCTVELVDGRKVEGRLAGQFKMDDHVIVYSPRLATVRSFLKQHVHALTVDGKREQLNPRRELTPEDRKLLGRVDWPDKPPAKGLKPAFTTEKWDGPKQLMVWAKPGKSGRFDEAGNWLINGAPARKLGATAVWGGPAWGRSRGSTSLDKDTDLLIPVAPKSYQVRARRGSYIARHITIESNGFLSHNLKGAYGNLWVAQEGRLDGGGCAYLRGDRHSFFVNGERRGENRPPDGYYLQGETVKVELSTENKELEIRYTLNGDEPSAKSQLYENPVPVKKDSVVKAASFKGGKKYGDTAVAEFQFVSPGHTKLLDSSDPGSTSPGLSWKYYDYDSKWKGVPDFSARKPAKTGVAELPDVRVVEKRAGRFAMVFEGFLEVREEGMYSVQIGTSREDECHVYIDGQAVIENGKKHLRSNGLVGLKAGTHRLKIVFVDSGWGEQLSLKLRKLGNAKTGDVTSEMFSH
jgi:hypothetical protein